MLNYKCLVLDHDDTVVNSTATVNFPAFQQTLAVIRPNVVLTLEEYIRYNFDPGFSTLCYDILGFSEQEMEYQTENWRSYVTTHVPPVYKGFPKLLHRFHDEGGIICVVSHSMRFNIERDYQVNGLPEPRLIFGWDVPPEHRKPSSWALEEIMRQLSLSPKDLLMADDLKPGKTMADRCGVDFAAAGWGHKIPEIVTFMKRECSCYCSTVGDLEKLLFS